MFKMTILKIRLFLLLMLLSVMNVVADNNFSVQSFGAKGDGKTLDTQAIQSAIDAAFINKGGKVVVPSGVYLIGTLILKDNVELHLQSGAVLLGSPNLSDYSTVEQKFESRTKDLYTRYFMIFAEGAKNISISGFGEINGNGLDNFRIKRPQNKRPYMIRLVDCDNVVFTGVTLRESGNWTLHLLGCHNVKIDNINVKATAEDGNRDGIDIDACNNVIIANSLITTTDDAIVLKSSCEKVCENILISNCIISSNASGIKTGTESTGGYRNIAIDNCIIKDIPFQGGIDLTCVDGGVMENIRVNNIIMDNVSTPFFIRLGSRLRGFKPDHYAKKINEVKDIYLNNITVHNAKKPAKILGLKHIPIKNVVISNYLVHSIIAQNSASFENIGLQDFDYPAAHLFDKLPTYGLFCRYVDGLEINGMKAFAADEEIYPAFAFDGVKNANMFNVNVSHKNINTPLAYLKNTQYLQAYACNSYYSIENLFVKENNCSNIYVNDALSRKYKSALSTVSNTKDVPLFYDFNTSDKITVQSTLTKESLPYITLSEVPHKVKFDIEPESFPQLCLLVSGEDSKPKSILLKYGNIQQEFIVNWTNWGWASISLNPQIKKTENIEFEITADGENPVLLSKIYLRKTNNFKTD